MYRLDIVELTSMYRLDSETQPLRGIGLPIPEMYFLDYFYML